MNEVVHAAGRGAVAAMAMTGMELCPVDRAGLAADRLLYGLVPSEGRPRPQEGAA